MNELQHLQKVVLLIAKDVDKLCRENNIHYYLGGGGAIGAVRHKGFIPWDDDLDFLMPYEEFERFVLICRDKLDCNKYEIDQDTGCCALPELKIRLKGTYIEEKGRRREEGKCQGIFVDVFRLEHSPKSSFWRHIQYYSSKFWIANHHRHSGYKTDDARKKRMIGLSSILDFPPIRTFVKWTIFRWNKKKVNTLGCLWGITRYKNTFTACEIYGTPKYLPFEDTEFPLPEHYHEYLTQFFGDYMQLPPVEKRVAPHISKIDFGTY